MKIASICLIIFVDNLLITVEGGYKCCLYFQITVRGQAGCQHHAVNILMLCPGFS
jgi:hypothetical protein